MDAVESTGSRRASPRVRLSPRWMSVVSCLAVVGWVLMLCAKHLRIVSPITTLGSANDMAAGVYSMLGLAIGAFCAWARRGLLFGNSRSCALFGVVLCTTIAIGLVSPVVDGVLLGVLEDRTRMAVVSLGLFFPESCFLLIGVISLFRSIESLRGSGVASRAGWDHLLWTAPLVAAGLAWCGLGYWFVIWTFPFNLILWLMSGAVLVFILGEGVVGLWWWSRRVELKGSERRGA